MGGWHTKRIDKFLGVDFSAPAGLVDQRRSPDGVNMVPASGGTLQKRTGYRTVRPLPSGGQVYGIFSTGDILYVHHGTILSSFDGENLTPLCTDMAPSPSSGFVMDGALYLLDGTTYRRVKDGIAAPAADRAYAPLTSVARTPAGAGTKLEAENLISGRRRNRFRGDGTSKTFVLDAAADTKGEISVKVNGSAVTSGFSFNGAGTAVVFSSAPAAAGEEDNVEITFCKKDPPADPISGCRLCGIYGSAQTRVFVSGNPSAPATDWHSGLLDPTYFPADGYTCVGDDDAPIMGYARQYDAQIILKGEGSAGAAHFLRSWAVDGEGTAYFPVAQSMSGIACLAPRSVATVLDQPLYLSDQGVCSWSSSAVTSQRNTAKRSNRIDPRLTAEPNLDRAFAVAFGSRYYLFVGDHCYMADLLKVSEDGSGFSQFEWYYLEGIPATAACVHRGDLWFGTGDGRLCVMRQETEGSAYDDDGMPVAARWTTPYMDLGESTRKKTVRDIHVTLCPNQGQSSACVSYATEDTYKKEAGVITMISLSWNAVDFGHFSFRTITQPRTVLMPSRVHDTMYFQVILENDLPFQNMALLGVDMTYRTGRRIV